MFYTIWNKVLQPAWNMGGRVQVVEIHMEKTPGSLSKIEVFDS